ncbi:hypothetical protein Taro_049507 [Colocasia esculenta]|uniref:Uncharacterized protein n=1 Tax=Colocasia esculenta TaxID=4460 RepID=A0A843XB08_COLES|nr:hypothetical protein [Colocasia esculenta]
MLKYSPLNPRDEFYHLLGLCGGVLGGWAAVERPQEGHLLPLFICYVLFNPSTWSRPKFEP